MATTTLYLELGNNPKLHATVKVTPTINSSNTVTFTYNYTLEALSSPSYWGFGVILQYRTRKENGDWSSWGSTTIIKENTNTWSAKTGTGVVTLTGCTNSTNAYIQFRLQDVGADLNTTYTAQSVFVDIVKLTLSKAANIFSLIKSPSQTYHIAGDPVTINCVLDSVEGYQIKFDKWKSNSSCTTDKSSQKSSFNVSDTEEVTLTASANKTPNSGTIYYYPNGGSINNIWHIRWSIQ